jgi:hypothetical protein
MALVLAWKDSAGGKVRLSPLPDGETQQERARRLGKLFGRAGAAIHEAVVVDEAALPGGNNELRAAWDIVGSAVVVTLPRAKRAVAEKIAAWSHGEIAVWRGRRIAAQVAGDSAGVATADAAIAEWTAMPLDPAIEAAGGLPALRTILQAAQAKRTGEAEN